MGKREREKWDLLTGQGAVLAVLSILFLLGGVAGCLFSALAGGEDASALSLYLTDYLTLAREGIVVRSLWSVVWEQIRYLLAVVVLGITAVGVVGVPVLFCLRGFFFSFSVGCFCRVFGWGGLVPALVLFGLPALLWGPALFLAGFQGLSGARCLLRRGLGDGRCPLPFTTSYWLRIGFCVLLCVACAGTEYWIFPVLLRAAAHVVL